jgi:hypothetical protein
MKFAAFLLLSIALFPAWGQAPPAGPQDGSQRPMPPPERRMGWEERQRLREQVHSGQMSREEARQRWHEFRSERRGHFSPEQREQLRRDVIDANRGLQRH